MSEVSEELLSQFMDNSDFSNLEMTMDRLLNHRTGFRLRDYINDVISGDVSLSLSSLWNVFLQSFQIPFENLSGEFARLLAILLFASVFTGLARAFQHSKVSESGFYVTYMILFSVLSGGYLAASEVVKEGLSELFEFMKVLIPVFCTSIFVGNGEVTAAGASATMLMILGVMDHLLLHVFFPVVHTYFLISLANHLISEAPFQKLSELLLKGVRLGMKGLLAIVTLLTGMVSCVAPAIDKTKRGLLVKGVEMIPGIGSLFGTVSDTIRNAGNVLKGAVGTGGMVFVLLLCAFPLLQVVGYVLCYRLAAAVAEPVAEKRFIDCLSDASEGIISLLQILFVGMVSFLTAIIILIRVMG